MFVFRVNKVSHYLSSGNVEFSELPSYGTEQVHAPKESLQDQET